MAFKPRPSRPATGATVLRRSIEHALHDPHAASERFDPDFMLALRCEACGKGGTAPRRFIREAIRSHVEDSCPERHRAKAIAVRVFYPKQ